jgi:lipopolysaccharide biosynthesis glycosyltransferase
LRRSGFACSDPAKADEFDCMSLASLCATLSYAPPRREDSPTENVGLFFAFDSGYLTPFRVMLYSMARAGTFFDVPVFVATDDPAVAQDAFVQAVADRIILLDESEMSVLIGLSRTALKRQEKAQWHRGTFLKWSVFDDYPVDRMLFLDVDMLCLRPFQDVLQYTGEEHLIGCPQFHQTLSKVEPEGYPAPQKLKVVRQLMKGQIFRQHQRLNSGVMLIGKKYLSRSFRNELIEFCADKSAANEQSLLTQYFRDAQGSLRLVSSRYNFHESVLGRLDPVDAFSVLRDIAILHYPGSPKPWKIKASMENRLTTLLWYKYRDSAAAHGFLASQ